MLNGCILIKVVTVKVDEVVKQVKQLKQVKKAYIAYGRFDIIAFIECRNYEEVRRVTAKINNLAAVRSTETLVEA